jgi:hypothetical protein
VRAARASLAQTAFAELMAAAPRFADPAAGAA